MSRARDEGFDVTKSPYGKGESFTLTLDAQKTAFPKNPKHKRYNSFVIVPGLPLFPTAHPGADDTKDLRKEKFNPDHIELLRLGEATVATLSKDKNLCPNVIFLLPSDDNPKYTPHLLSTYIPQLDKQSNEINFHIAAHGDNKKIGSTTLDSRLDMELFATLMSSIVEHIPADPKGKQTLHFTFHSCNSALCNLDETREKLTHKKIAHDQGAQQISAAINEESLIGHFAREMKELGHTNITVSGFRGYYSNLDGGHSVVSEAVESKSSTPAEKTKFTIDKSGTVTIPTLPFFKVELRPGMSLKSEQHDKSTSELEKLGESAAFSAAAAGLKDCQPSASSSSSNGKTHAQQVKPRAHGDSVSSPSASPSKHTDNIKRQQNQPSKSGQER